MFNSKLKKDISELSRKLNLMEDRVFKPAQMLHYTKTDGSIHQELLCESISAKLNKLTNEHQRLKQIVNELVDYVYKNVKEGE